MTEPKVVHEWENFTLLHGPMGYVCLECGEGGYEPDSEELYAELARLAARVKELEEELRQWNVHEATGGER